MILYNEAEHLSLLLCCQTYLQQDKFTTFTSMVSVLLVESHHPKGATALVYWSTYVNTNFIAIATHHIKLHIFKHHCRGHLRKYQSRTYSHNNTNYCTFIRQMLLPRDTALNSNTPTELTTARFTGCGAGHKFTSRSHIK